MRFDWNSYVWRPTILLALISGALYMGASLASLGAQVEGLSNEIAQSKQEHSRQISGISQQILEIRKQQKIDGQKLVSVGATVSELKEAHGQRLERIERLLDQLRPVSNFAKSD